MEGLAARLALKKAKAAAVRMERSLSEFGEATSYLYVEMEDRAEVSVLQERSSAPTIACYAGY